MIHAWIFNGLVKITLRSDVEKDLVRKIVAGIKIECKKIPLTSSKDTMGNALLMATCQKNVAFYRSALKCGISEQDAKKYIENLNWNISKLMGSPMWTISILKGLNSRRRLNWIDKILWRFLFTEPFARRLIETDADLSFDIMKCPIQEYYRSQNALDLCYHAACVQDYKLAGKWRMDLKRAQTLASGAEKCDFRFYSKKG